MKIKLMPMLAGAIALGVVATPFVVKAQANHSGQPLIAQAQQGQQHQGKWAKLNLTDAQKEQMRQLKKETHDQIQSVLTQEQKDKIQAMRASRQGQNHQGKNRQEMRNGMASLNLTDDQKAKIKAIKQAQKSRMEAILTDQQKQQLEQMRQEWKQRRQQRQQGNQ
jgi:Spy/CpxP family protein refolding chaperone